MRWRERRAMERSALPSVNQGSGTVQGTRPSHRYTLSMPFRIRPNIQSMAPYVPGKPIDEVKRELGLNHVTKLASNENPLGPSPKALAAVAEAAHDLHLYPDASGHLLTVKLAEKAGVDPRQVVLGNGSDEILSMLGLAFLQPGDNIVVGKPTFVRYEAAGQLADCEIREVPLDAGMRHDLPAMVAACDASTKLVFLANPHNPTGTTVNPESIADFRAQLPETALLVMDEAYYEYAVGSVPVPDSVAMVREGLPVISLRTFSKAYGLAGIRIGYAIGPREVIEALNLVRAPFHVNSLAQAAAIAALDDDDHLARSRAVNAAGMKILTDGASGLGCETVPSAANFVCIKVPTSDTELFRELLKCGVIVRPGTPLGMPGYLRVSVGTEQECREFLSAFGQVLSSLPTA